MFADWVQALVLGIVQGLTEFIPVSSSGHLVLIPYLLGWEKNSLAFDVMLHVGTMFAVLLFFRGELIAIVKGILRLDTTEQGQIYRRVGLFILPASVPIGLVGLTLESQVEEVFASPLAAALLLLVTAGLLLGLEAYRSQRVSKVPRGRAVLGTSSQQTSSQQTSGLRAGEAEAPAWQGDWRGSGTPAEGSPPDADLPLGIDDSDPAGASLANLTFRQAMVAGLFQCLAVLPGVSRSGSTIAGGVFSGLTREAATRFSFLLVIPALFGATVLSLGDLGEGGEGAGSIAIGVLAAFLSGYAAIRFLVRLVSRERLNGFAYYCIAASAVGLIGYLMIGPPSSV